MLWEYLGENEVSSGYKNRNMRKEILNYIKTYTQKYNINSCFGLMDKHNLEVRQRPRLDSDKMCEFKINALIELLF